MFNDTSLKDPLGVRAEVQALFESQAQIDQILEIEVALAKAQAEIGCIPTSAADEIVRSAKDSGVRPDGVLRHARRVGHPMVAILDAWCEGLSEDAAQWVHYGTTTADIVRTVTIRQLHGVTAILERHMRAVESRLAAMAHEHRSTPMIGRTLGRHGLPITWGLKVSVWLAEHRRNLDRLQQWRKRFDTGVLSGAVGTYSITAQDGPAIEQRALAYLGLGEPQPVDPKGSMDVFAEFGAALAICARSYERMAQEIFLLQGDDIRELAVRSSAIGSSTMPHKSNPVLCIDVMSGAREVAAALPVLLEWMVVVHERDSAMHGGVVERLCIDMAQVVSCVRAMLDQLQVLPENMRRNMDRTNGAVLTESVTALLAPVMGRRAAHDLMHELSTRMARTGEDLTSLLRSHPATVGLQLPSVEDSYGLAPQIVDRTLAALRLSAPEGVDAQALPNPAETR